MYAERSGAQRRADAQPVSSVSRVQFSSPSSGDYLMSTPTMGPLVRPVRRGISSRRRLMHGRMCAIALGCRRTRHYGSFGVASARLTVANRLSSLADTHVYMTTERQGLLAAQPKSHARSVRKGSFANARHCGNIDQSTMPIRPGRDETQKYDTGDEARDHGRK